MTVIAAMLDRDAGIAYIGSDSDGSNGYSQEDHGTKVRQIGPRIAVGWSGTYLLERWVRRSLADLLTFDDGQQHTEPERFRPKLEDAWDAWRGFARGLGHGATQGTSFDITGELVVATPERLYICQCDGAVLDANGYSASGSGKYAAMGSLRTSEQLRERFKSLKAEEAVRLAIEGAIRHVTSCGGEVHLLSVGGSG